MDKKQILVVDDEHLLQITFSRKVNARNTPRSWVAYA